MEARLLAGSGGFESASAQGAVRGDLQGEGGEVGELAAAQVEVAFDAASGEPSALALSSAGPRSSARFILRAADGGSRRLSAPEIRLAMSGGEPRESDAWGGVVLEQRLAGEPARVARAEKAHARFGAGATITAAELEGGVVLHDGELRAAGDRAVLEDGGRRATLTGAPATGRSPRGEMRAPVLVYERAGAHLRAENGVRARFESASEGLPGAGTSGGEPIAVEANEGSFRLEPRGFEFAGTVQAVQGDTLLFADRLSGDDVAGRSQASGQVRTVWTDRRSPAGGAAATSTILAETLDYARDAGVLRYAGDVRVRQGGRELRAAECVVELDDEGSAESMVASGGVVIEDRETGRRIEGERADYDLIGRTAVVTGEPVVLRERSGTVLSGRRAAFDLETGSARLLSDPP
jgi:lipopolysaccharide export system protein LptA